MKDWILMAEKRIMMPVWNGHRRITAAARETRRLSDGRVDGVTVASRRVDAIDANLKFGNGWKSL